MANKVNFYKSDKPEELRDFYKVLGITQTATDDEVKTRIYIPKWILVHFKK